jgi:hypothetical protein
MPDRHHRQRAAAARRPAARGGRDRHARRHQRWPDHLRLRARHRDGIFLLLPQSGRLARAVLRGARPDPPRVDGAGTVSLHRQALPLSLRQPLAAATAAAPPADLAARDRQPGDGGVRRRASLPVHDGLLARLAAAARLRALPAPGGGEVRLRGAARAARLLRPVLRRRDGRDRPPRGGAPPFVAVPQGPEARPVRHAARLRHREVLSPSFRPK